MNQQPIHRHRMSREQMRRRQRRRTARRVAGVTVVLAVAAGGVSFALSRDWAAPSASAASGTAVPSAGSEQTAASAETAASGAASSAGAMTAAEAQAILDDPLMVLVNHTNKMPDGYTFETKECGSVTAANKTLQTAACDAFLQMQAAAAAEGVTVNMQSGYRTVEYQTTLYDRKTNYYIGQGYDETTARQLASNIVNPPGYSEHNCGLAADLNTPEHTALDEGFKDTAAYRWLCAHAGEYGFILRYPEGREDVTDVTYEPWHWRYVGAENAARINESGLVFEEYIAMLQRIVAGE